MMTNLLTPTIDAIEPTDVCWRDKAIARINMLTMPPWALGQLLDLSVDLAGMTRSMNPAHRRRTVVIMAGDHGVADEGVSAFPQEVTVQMVGNFASDGAAVNVLARQMNAHVVVVDAGVAGDLSDLVAAGAVIDRKVASGTANMARGPAMSREQAIQSVMAGIACARELGPDTDVFATGDMGIANTTPSSAIVSVLCGLTPDEVTGNGTGIDESTRNHKAKIIGKSLAINTPDANDALDVLAKVGGFEIGAIAGLILGAAAQSKPIVIDGFISTAGALIAHGLCPQSADYMIAAHKSVERGHAASMERLGKKPLLDLGLRLGEGTGAVLAMNLVEAAIGILTDMATFETAGVSEKIED